MTMPAIAPALGLGENEGSGVDVGLDVGLDIELEEEPRLLAVEETAFASIELHELEIALSVDWYRA